MPPSKLGSRAAPIRSLSCTPRFSFSVPNASNLATHSRDCGRLLARSCARDVDVNPRSPSPLFLVAGDPGNGDETGNASQAASGCTGGVTDTQECISVNGSGLHVDYVNASFHNRGTATVCGQQHVYDTKRKFSEYSTRQCTWGGESGGALRLGKTNRRGEAMLRGGEEDLQLGTRSTYVLA